MKVCFSMRFISALNSASFARRRLISVQLVFFMSFILRRLEQKNRQRSSLKTEKKIFFFGARWHGSCSRPRATLSTFLLAHFFVNGFASVSFKVSGTHASDFLTFCLNVQVTNYLAVPISFVLIVIEVNGALHIPNKRASGWLVFATEVSANHIRATVTRGFFFLQWLKFNVIVFHNLFLVCFAAESSVDGGWFALNLFPQEAKLFV